MQSKSKIVNAKMAGTIPLVKEPMENEAGGKPLLPETDEQEDPRWEFKRSSCSLSESCEQTKNIPPISRNFTWQCSTLTFSTRVGALRVHRGAGERTHLGSDVLFNQ